jgi:hypothetical protein
MNLTGESGLQRVIPVNALKRVGGYRTLDILAATTSKKSVEWRAESKDKIIYVKFYGHSLTSSMSETELGALRDSTVIGGYTYLQSGMPTTYQIIDFMKWKISEDQIIEFFDY